MLRCKVGRHRCSRILADGCSARAEHRFARVKFVTPGLFSARISLGIPRDGHQLQAVRRIRGGGAAPDLSDLGPLEIALSLDEPDSCKEDIKTWAGLRSASEGALKQGNLDRYLWWSYASDARKRLLKQRKSLRGEAAVDAARVVAACAKANVDRRSGIYSAWVRSVSLGGHRGRAGALPFRDVANTILALAQAGVTTNKKRVAEADVATNNKRFWLECVPDLLLASAHTASGSDLANAASAYSIARFEEAKVFALFEHTVLADGDVERLTLRPADAADLLWAYQSCGYVHSQLFWHLWSQVLESRLSELSHVQLAALAVYAGRLRIHSSEGTVVAQLVLNLQKRAMLRGSIAPAAEDLCRAVDCLSMHGLLTADDLYLFVECVIPSLDSLSLGALAGLYRTVANLDVLDYPLLIAISQRLRLALDGEALEVVQAQVEPDAQVSRETAAASTHQVGHAPAERINFHVDQQQPVFVALEAATRLRSDERSRDLIPDDVLDALCRHASGIALGTARVGKRYEQPSVADTARVTWALQQLGRHDDAKHVLRAANASLGSFSTGQSDALELEALLRVLSAPQWHDHQRLATASVNVAEALAANGQLPVALRASSALSISLMRMPVPPALRSLDGVELARAPKSSILTFLLSSLLEPAGLDESMVHFQTWHAAGRSLDWTWIGKLLAAPALQAGHAGDWTGLERRFVQLFNLLHQRQELYSDAWPPTLDVPLSGFDCTAYDLGLAEPSRFISANNRERLHAWLWVLLTNGASISFDDVRGDGAHVCALGPSQTAQSVVVSPEGLANSSQQAPGNCLANHMPAAMAWLQRCITELIIAESSSCKKKTAPWR